MQSLVLRVTCVVALTACASASQDPDAGQPDDRPDLSDCDDGLPDVVPLFDGSASPEPVVTVRADGVIETRAAGRVRGRHELEGGFSTYGGRYFENRSYGILIEDFVPTGDPRIVVHYLPEARVSQNGPGTNFRVWKVHGNGNVFHSNGGMEELDPRHLTATVDENRREGGPLRTGQVMEFEFGIFIAGFVGGDPEPIEGRTSYYTDTFRYQVGVGGLVPENQDPSGLIGPEPTDWLAGEATIPWVYAEPEMAFSQMALNTQPENVQGFLNGRRVFHTRFDDGTHSESGNPALPGAAGLLGPSFNVASCVSCHVRNGRGEVEPVGEELTTSVIKLYDSEAFGGQLQPQEVPVERQPWSDVPTQLPDGTTVTLRAPVYDSSLGSELEWSVRRPRQITGLGLLEAIDEEDLLAVAVPDACDQGEGVSGRASLVRNPESGELQLGRFGWKAEKISLRHQIADALIEDMGVTTDVFDGGSEPELDDEHLDDLTTYMRLLSLPGRQDAADPRVNTGRMLFAQAGCTACHTPEHTTGSTHPFAELREQTIQPYTDLLLHDMGPGLSDPAGPLASEWRTPPLWGLGTLVDVDDDLHLLHDGRARGVAEAVLWHGGEAQSARDAFARLAAEERDALVAFVLSL